MSSSWFLAVAGITGDSTVQGHENELEVTTWSWGLSNSSAPSGSGAGSGRPVLDDLVVTLASHAGALQLIGMCATGRHAQIARLVGVRSGGGGQPFTFLRYELQRVTVTSVAQVASEDGSVSHRVALRFGGMRTTFTSQTSSGAAGTPVSVDVGTVTP